MTVDRTSGTHADTEALEAEGNPGTNGTDLMPDDSILPPEMRTPADEVAYRGMPTETDREEGAPR